MDAQQRNQVEFLETLAENRRIEINSLQSQLDTARGEVERYKAMLKRVVFKVHFAYEDEPLETEALNLINGLGLQTDKEVGGE